MDFKFLDHTADAKFRAYGKDLEEAFSSASYAMFSILFNPENVSSLIKKKISIRSSKKTSLLYDYLEELLFLLDVDGFILHKVEKIKIFEFKNSNGLIEYELEAEFSGDYFRGYEISGNIKSITYNDMEINENFSELTFKKVMLQVVVDL